MSQLSVDQAADALGVSHVQVGRLIDAGELDAKRFGRSWAIDSDSLHRYRVLRPRRGRPLSERAAWQRVLEAEPPADIDEAIDLARFVRRRSRNERVRILPALDARIDDDPRVRHGGAHAAIRHGASIGRPEQRDVYISALDADAFRSDYRANPNADHPNVVVRVVDELIAGDDQFLPPIVAVLDLLDAADTRAASEALRAVR
ncbi:helix-turn-helix domain-containing protein [Ilumatobacter sp.]|uniref:helix-turn-helix domain-containing protein n=1 Tax=Ilumatobacter sp. TaxID=1967498 RepID=UPI003B51C5C3